MRSPAAAIAIVLFAMVAALLAVRLFAPQTFATGDDQVRLVYLVGWLALLSAGLFTIGRINIGHALRSMLIWCGIGLFLIAIYSLREDFGALYAKMRGEIVPHAPIAAEAVSDPGGGEAGGGAASVRRAMDGHFWAEARVNGARVRFLVDTGASTVALTRSDARRIGLDLDALRYTAQVMTANGLTQAAPVRLRQISVGGVRVDDVEALVMETDALNTSLLGMSFLGRLSRYEATQDALILRR